MTTRVSKVVPVPNGTHEFLKNYIEATRGTNKALISQASEALKQLILEKVKDAIDKLYENDIWLIETGMNEMTICGRLAMYMQGLLSDFHNYYVDVEYYRLKKPRNDIAFDIRKDRIRCDILFHSRQHYEARVDNLLAIEVKLEDNVDDGKSDICRLAEFILPKTSKTPPDAIHSTLIGLFLRMGKKGYNTIVLNDMGYEPKKGRIRKKLSE